MDDLLDEITALARDLVAIDSRSFVSSHAVADRVETALPGFDIERIDYADPAGVAKRTLVAHRGGPGGIALSGHMDTVPATGWQDDPWAARVADGMLHGLGAVDMKGPLAAAIVAARGLPPSVPVTLLISSDEETTKEGARRIAAESVLARQARLAGIVLTEPTAMAPVRGHRVNIEFTVTATGVQAHSSTGRGLNANWLLIPFLAEMRALHFRLREDAGFHDPAYDPPFSDFNLTLDNFGTALNVTVPRAVAHIKFRYSRSIDPAPVVAEVRAAASRAGLAVTEREEGTPPELPAADPFVQLAERIAGRRAGTAPYGTDASQLQALAPCVILGPGELHYAHRPDERVCLADLAAAIPVLRRFATEAAGA